MGQVLIDGIQRGVILAFYPVEGLLLISMCVAPVHARVCDET